MSALQNVPSVAVNHEEKKVILLLSFFFLFTLSQSTTNVVEGYEQSHYWVMGHSSGTLPASKQWEVYLKLSHLDIDLNLENPWIQWDFCQWSPALFLMNCFLQTSLHFLFYMRATFGVSGYAEFNFQGTQRNKRNWKQQLNSANYTGVLGPFDFWPLQESHYRKILSLLDYQALLSKDAQRVWAIIIWRHSNKDYEGIVWDKTHIHLLDHDCAHSKYAKPVAELGGGGSWPSAESPGVAAQSEAWRCQPVSSSVSPYLTSQGTRALYSLCPHYKAWIEGEGALRCRCVCLWKGCLYAWFVCILPGWTTCVVSLGCTCSRACCYH